ncbi:MAG: ABC transporter ATP-binding protein/permease [Acholeplasmatales bacterium]|nr:ABC transporter ATP-binding protein/permease [Acholeplasmatales bacterium]
MHRDTYTFLKLKRISFISFILYLLFQGSLLISPIIMKKIIDIYIPLEDIRNTIYSIIIFVLLPCLVVLVQVLYNYITIKYIRNEANLMSIQILKHTCSKPLSFFNDNNSIELSSKISQDTINYLSYFVSEYPEQIVSIILLIASITYVFINNLTIGLIQLLFIPLLFPIKLIYKNIDSKIKKTIHNNHEASQIRGDLFRGIKYVKTMNIENYSINKIDSLNKETSEIWGKIASLDTLSGFWGSGFLTMLFSGLTFGLSAFFFIDGIIPSIGTIIAIFSYSQIYYNYTNKVFKNIIDHKKIDLTYQDLLKEHQKRIQTNQLENKIILDDINTIRIKDLNYSYSSNKEILSNISMDFLPKKIYGIKGKSGIGKTTILDLLIKLYPSPAGKIFINDHDINELDEKNIRSLISKVTQEVFIFPGTIKENFLIVNNHLKDEEIYEYLELVDLKNHVLEFKDKLNSIPGELGKLLSGGERQRLSIAISLSRNKKWILLDEITSNMDSFLEIKIKNNLKNYFQANEISSIIVTHSEELLSICDFIYEIK